MRLMNQEKPISDKLGPLPPEAFDNDFHPDPLPVVKAGDLTERERALVARVMRDFPTLSEAEAIKRLRAGGL
jgi:hypothetical protein